MARAINKVGQTQTAELIPNPAGYHHNVMHTRHAQRRLRGKRSCTGLPLPRSPCSSQRPHLPEEPTIELKKAPGLDKVETNCAACHSLDYIQMNSPFPNAALWDAEVTKMIKVYGAPISDADAAVIVDYLKRNYGS